MELYIPNYMHSCVSIHSHIRTFIHTSIQVYTYTQINSKMLELCLFTFNSAYTFNSMKLNVKWKWKYIYLIPCITPYSYAHTYVHSYIDQYRYTHKGIPKCVLNWKQFVHLHITAHLQLTV